MDEITIIQFVNAISYSMILILGAIGLSIIFGLMGVINMAHGELFMLGAYTAVMAQKLGMNLWGGILISPIFVGIVGLALEVSIIRRFYTRPFVTLVATWGISIIFRQLIKMLFGPGHQIIRNPLAGSLDLFGIAYPKYRLLIMLITGIILIFLFVFFHKTPFGLKCRAIIQNRDMSTALGINVGDVDRWTFSIGAALAGMAGAIMTPLITINPEMGLPFLSQSFLVVLSHVHRQARPLETKHFVQRALDAAKTDRQHRSLGLLAQPDVSHAAGGAQRVWWVTLACRLCIPGRGHGRSNGWGRKIACYRGR